MGDVDAGNVKAKASIEYDGSGLKQMKEDLASLSDTLGGGLEQNTQRASDALSGLGESMSGSAGGAKEFSAALEELPKIAEGGTSAVAEMSGVIAEHRAVAEEAGAAQETFSRQVESTVSSFEKATPSIQAATEHTQKFAQSVQAASEHISNSMGTDALSENMAVFEDALVNPYPFSVIDQHLVETGQTWSGFTSSIGDSNTAILQNMADYGQKTYDVLDGVSSQVKSTGQTFIESATGAEEFTKQFNGVADSTASASKAINEFGGVGSAMYEPTEAVKSFNSAINELGGVGDAMYGPAYSKPVTLGGAFSEVMGGIGNTLNEIAMPLMAAQMIGMAVQQVGQAMYDSAAIAEGPAAHSFGTFTGTVDALGQSLQRIGGQFSESFGQAFLPTLNALNNQAGSGDGGWGGIIGGISSTIANLSLITTGIDPWAGTQGLINQGAAMLGLQQPFQGPGPTTPYQQYMAALPQTIRQNTQQAQEQTNLTMEEAVNPAFLAQQQQLSAAQTIYQRAQQSYDISHPVNLAKMKSDAQYNLYAQQQAENYQYQMNNQPPWTPQDFFDYWGGVAANNNSGATGSANRYGTRGPGQIAQPERTDSGGGIDLGGFFGGIGKSISDFWNQPNGGADTLGMLFSPQAWGFGGQSSPQTFTGGCFVAGTPVLLADGREKAIEDVRVDDMVLSYDGVKQVITPVLAIMQPTPKRVYKLTFDDGRTLTLTNAHPLQGVDGWKSLSPEATAQENPGLEVTPLVVGDIVCTVNGACTLTSILPLQGVRQIYNIEVGEPHTFYAGGILVHNKVASSTGSMSNGGVGSEQVQLSHTFTAQVQWEANNLTKQFTGAASWVGQNLANTFMGAASWVGQGLANTFQGVANWVGQGLSNTFNGIASWVGQNLANTFNGVADWVGQNLSNTFNGVASWAGTGLTNTFKGVASWAAQGLEHTFNAVANWTAQNLTPNFTVNPSFTMLAEGTSNWGGGPAIVGEGGAPEVVEHNGQYSLIDHATLLDLPAGANVYPMKNLQSAGVAQFADGTGNYMLPLTIGIPGGGMPQSINVNVHLDSQTILSAVEIPMAQNIRVASGLRSY